MHKASIAAACTGQSPVIYKTDFFLLQSMCVCLLSCLSNVAGIIQPAVQGSYPVWITTGGLSWAGCAEWIIWCGLSRMG